jgi:hypothetical protein
MNAYLGGFHGKPSTYMPDMDQQIIYMKFSELAVPGGRRTDFFD